MAPSFVNLDHKNAETSKEEDCLIFTWLKSISRKLLGNSTTAAPREGDDFVFRQLIELFPQAVQLKDATTLNWVLYNRKAVELTGYTRDEVIGKNFYDLYSKEQADFFVNEDHKALEGKRPVEAPEEIVSLPIGTRVLSTVRIPILDHRNRPKYLLVVSEDVTEKKKKALEADRFQAIANQAGVAFFIREAITGKLVDLNQTACKWLGYSKEELLQLTPGAFEIGAPAYSREEWREHIDQVIQQDNLMVWQGRHIRRDGSTYPAESTRSIRRFGGRKYVIDVVRDLTHQKELEGELESQRAKAIESARLASLGEVAGGVAHEINNPLAIIHGYTSKLLILSSRGQVDRAELEFAAAKIQTTTERIASIVRGLRSFSRDGSFDAFEAVPVSNLIEETMSFMAERFKMRGIALKLPKVEFGLSIECQRVPLSQVLINLMNNAFDAVQSHKNAWVEVEVADLGDWVEISVIDSGDGVADAIKDKIGQPFFTTKEVGKGTGLGLSVSRGIVQNHNGQLYLDDERENTRFVVRVPKVHISKAQKIA